MASSAESRNLGAPVLSSMVHTLDQIDAPQQRQVQIRLAQSPLGLAPAALRLAQEALRSAQPRVRLAHFGIPKSTTSMVSILALL